MRPSGPGPWWCGKKATCNARVIDGKVAKTGEQIVLGGSESYTSLCRKHWMEGNLGDCSGLETTAEGRDEEVP